MGYIRIVKQLFEAMYEIMVPGFCSLVDEALHLFGIDDIAYFDEIDNERKELKKMLIETQHKRLIETMMTGSKTDALLLNFSYDGCMKEYLMKLSFHEARMVFMLRARMFPTKVNFPSRWSSSLLCNYCCEKETDEHLFWCCGYIDIHRGEIDYGSFIRLNCNMDVLREAARILIKIYDRLLQTNGDLGGSGNGEIDS